MKKIIITSLFAFSVLAFGLQASAFVYPGGAPTGGGINIAPVNVGDFAQIKKGLFASSSFFTHSLSINPCGPSSPMSNMCAVVANFNPGKLLQVGQSTKQLTVSTAGITQILKTGVPNLNAADLFNAGFLNNNVFRGLKVNDIGNISVITGTAPNVGDVLTATNTSGNVGWSTPAAGTNLGTGALGDVLTWNGTTFAWAQPAAVTGMPIGAVDQTLRHNGTDWVANSFLVNTGTQIGIGTATPDTNVVFDVESNGGSIEIGGPNLSSQGYRTFATGNSNTVSGQYSSVFGAGNTTTGHYSTVFGTGNTNSGLGTFVGGANNTSTSAFSAIFGNQNISDGPSNAIFGSQNSITGSGNNAFVAGSNNTATQRSASAFGKDNNAGAQYSVAMGRGMTVNSSAINSIGFGLGEGPWTLNQANTFAVMGGKMGIGTTTPTARLTVGGNVKVKGEAFAQSGQSAKVILGDDHHSIRAEYGKGLYFDTFGVGVVDPFVIREGTGYVGVGTTDPTARLDVNGTFRLRSATPPTAGQALVATAAVDGTVEWGSAGDTLPNGTITDATLRWNGTNWVENGGLLARQNGQVQIGVNSSTATFKVGGNININAGIGTNVISGGATAIMGALFLPTIESDTLGSNGLDGKVLTSDVNGQAKWQNIPNTPTPPTTSFMNVHAVTSVGVNAHVQCPSSHPRVVGGGGRCLPEGSTSMSGPLSGSSRSLVFSEPTDLNNTQAGSLNNYTRGWVIRCGSGGGTQRVWAICAN